MGVHSQFKFKIKNKKTIKTIFGSNKRFFINAIIINNNINKNKYKIFTKRLRFNKIFLQCIYLSDV